MSYFILTYMLFSPELDTFVQCRAHLHADSAEGAVTTILHAFPGRARNVRAETLDGLIHGTPPGRNGGTVNPRWQRGPHARLDSLKLGVRVLTMAGEEGTIAGSMVRHVIHERQAETGECVVLQLDHDATCRQCTTWSGRHVAVLAGVAEVVVLGGAP